MRIKQSMGRMLSSNMLPLNLILLIDVTFSTPTPVYNSNAIGRMERETGIEPATSSLGSFSLRISSVCGIREVIENTGILNR